MDKRRLVRRLVAIQNRAINPLVCAAVERGLAPPTYALLETTDGGCRSPTALMAIPSG